MDDKKKKLVIGVLVAAILGIGAFQFTGSGGEEPAPVTEKKQEPTAAKIEDKTPVAPNGTYVEPLETRDPFAVGKLAGGPETQPQPEPVKTTEPAPQNTANVKPVPEITGGGPWGDFEPVNPKATAGLQVEEKQFGYSLVGVLVGEKPTAVFADAAGNQRLITVGGDLDADSKLLKVSQGKATVKFGKKTITLTIGGTASAK